MMGVCLLGWLRLPDALRRGGGRGDCLEPIKKEPEARGGGAQPSRHTGTDGAREEEGRERGVGPGRGRWPLEPGW